ncbi:MAG: hypothetical protein KY434_08280 [Actinobacteria bacterium]|nr:hypothetical protein [Actinomycetota bacterium]
MGAARVPARLLVSVAVLAALAAGVGAPVRATYGARTTADEPQYLLSAISLAEDGDLDIADELAARRWRAFHEAPLPVQTRPLAGGRRVSPHDPLLPMLLAPGSALAGWVGAKLTLAALAGALAALLAWTAVARLEVPPRVAWLCVAVFACSAPLAVYGTQVYPELPAALAVTAAVAAVTGRLGRGGLWMLGGAVVALPWLSVKYVPVAAVLALLAVVRLVRQGRAWAGLGLTVGLVAAGAVFLAVHELVWTGPTPYSSGDHFVDSGELGVVGFSPDYPGRSPRLLGLLVGRRFGIAAWQPAWLLAVPALAAVARRRPRGWAALTAPLAAGWLNATFVALTMQGWWFPGRQVVVVLPLAVLAVAWWTGGHPPARRALAVVGGLGVAGYAWLVVDGLAGRVTWVVDFARTGDPLYRLIAPALPDYLDVTWVTWTLHAAWVVAVAALAVWGWRSARRVAGGPQPTSNSVTMPSS